MDPARFTVDDFDELAALVIGAWTSGVDRDWSVAAGTLEWSCASTAEHTVDCVFSYALFLASGAQTRYPRFDLLRALPEAQPADLVEGLRAVTIMLAAVIRQSPPDARAIIVSRPQPLTAPPRDFATRGALEMVLHGHDVCTGLGIAYEPPAALCRRLDASAPWWPAPPVTPTDDPWSDLLQRSGRDRIPR